MKIVAILGSIIVLLLAGLFIAAPSIAEYLAFKKIGTPAERDQMNADYKEWRTKRLTLPTAALEAKPYSPEIQAAARAFEEELSKVQVKRKALSKKYQQEPLNAGNAAVAADLAELDPLFKAFEALVRRPDYRLPAFSSGRIHEKGALPTPDFTEILACVKLLRLKAISLASAGRIDEAMNLAETLVLASRADQFEMIITQLIGVAACSSAATTWNEVVRQCSDPAQLRAALEKQNRLAGQFKFFTDPSVPMEALDNIGTIRELRRRGIAVEYQDLTAQQIFAKMMNAQGDYLETRVLPVVKDDATLAKEVESHIAGYRNNPVNYGTGNGFVARTVGRFSSAMLFGMTRPNLNEARTRAMVAPGKFDLLRLETARKLYTLEKGRAPEKLADLVPVYLPELSKDPFAGQPGQGNRKEKKEMFKEAKAAFYSIGPDRKDNLNAISYDPTNGTQSAGDIALGR